MTRIIAGFAGSLALEVPRAGTRPTSDRVREAIFSALESRDSVRGTRVLDLYAGSGALGLEAASRGASSVTLVERHPAAAKACRTNADKVTRNAPKGKVPEISVNVSSVQSFLETSSAEWDVALIDPPYDIGDVEMRAMFEALEPRLAAGAIVMVERRTQSAQPEWPRGITFDRSKTYGDTTVWWALAR